MKFNTDPSFAGIARLKKTLINQVNEFESWVSTNDWNSFHHSHYDWWAFPIDRPSSYGFMWTVYEGEIAELKKDSHFVSKHIHGIELLAASWGWDLFGRVYIPNPHPEQKWQDWPVRLFKASLSAKIFEYHEIFESLKMYALDLIKRGRILSYGGKDLSWLFTTGIDPYDYK